MAWNLRSRPCLADPPAESPSIDRFVLGRILGLGWGQFTRQEPYPSCSSCHFTTLAPRLPGSFTRIPGAGGPLRDRLKLTPHFPRKKVNLSATIPSTTGQPSGLLVCLWFVLQTANELLAPRSKNSRQTSRWSDPSRFLSFSTRRPVFLVVVHNLVWLSSSPVSWVPPSLVRTLLRRKRQNIIWVCIIVLECNFYLEAFDSPIKVSVQGFLAKFKYSTVHSSPFS